jgi:hypothetical protein
VPLAVFAALLWVARRRADREVRSEAQVQTQVEAEGRPPEGT